MYGNGGGHGFVKWKIQNKPIFYFLLISLLYHNNIVVQLRGFSHRWNTSEKFGVEYMLKDIVKISIFEQINGDWELYQEQWLG